MEFEDNVCKVEQYVVVSTILVEKKAKCEAWISGEKDLPKEQTSRREAPGLAPDYKFSAKLRAKAEELSREADISTLKLYLQDIINNAMPQVESDLQAAVESSKKKIRSNVDEEQATAAVHDEFEVQVAALKLQGATLLEKRRPAKKRQHEPESARPTRREDTTTTSIIKTRVPETGSSPVVDVQNTDGSSTTAPLRATETALFRALHSSKKRYLTFSLLLISSF